MRFDDDFACMISDLYKDVNGFRPRGEGFWSRMEAMTDEGREAYFRTLVEDLKVVERMEDERKAAAAAIVRFDKFVAETIALGAKDTATAYRWIMDGSDADGDWEYLCFEHGLPYGFFKSLVNQ